MSSEIFTEKKLQLPYNVSLTEIFIPKSDEWRHLSKWLEQGKIKNDLAAFLALDELIVNNTRGFGSGVWNAVKKIQSTVPERLSLLSEWFFLDEQLISGFDNLNMLEIGLLDFDKSFICKTLPDKVGDGETCLVEHIRKTPIVKFWHTKSINETRLAQYVEFKKKLVEALEDYRDLTGLRNLHVETNVLDGISVRFGFLSKDDKDRIFNFLEERQLGELPLTEVINLNLEDVSEGREETYRFWRDIRRKLCRQFLSNGPEAVKEGRVPDFCPPNTNLSLEKMEIQLIHDLKNFLEHACDDRQRVILFNRWGLCGKKRTLQEVSEIDGVTRERIRQIQRQKEVELRASLTVSSRVISQLICEYPIELLEEKLNLLRNEFNEQRHFVDLLEIVSNERGVLLETEEDLLNEFFAVTPGPVPIEQAVSYIEDGFDCSRLLAERFLTVLETWGVVASQSECIAPRKLPGIEAVAHVLVGMPYPLNWKEIYRIINHHNFSEGKYNDERRTSSRYIGENHWIYWADKNSVNNYYGHISSLENAIDDELQEKVLDSALEYVRSNEGSGRVEEFHKEMFPNVDSFILRHVIREYGSSRGLTWSGQSQTNTFSIGPVAHVHNHQDALFSMLEKAGKEGMTVKEMTYQYYRKSRGLIMMNLHILMRDRKILRITHDRYAAAELHLKKIGEKIKKVILKNLQFIIEQARDKGMVVEGDYFRKVINSLEGYNYPKPFYISLAKYFADELNVEYKRNLFGSESSSLDSMNQVMKKYCQPHWSLEQCKDELQKYILLTDREISRSHGIWKRNIVLEEDE